MHLPAAEFAYNSSVSEELGNTPFEVDLCWNPKNPLDLLRNDDSRLETVTELKNELESSFIDATFSHELAKSRAASYSANKYKEPDYKAGDEVWLHKTLFRDAITRSQPSAKLSAKRYGPFVIVQPIGKHFCEARSTA